jgi:hypothetical protein
MVRYFDYHDIFFSKCSYFFLSYISQPYFKATTFYTLLFQPGDIYFCFPTSFLTQSHPSTIVVDSICNPQRKHIMPRLFSLLIDISHACLPAYITLLYKSFFPVHLSISTLCFLFVTRPHALVSQAFGRLARCLRGREGRPVSFLHFACNDGAWQRREQGRRHCCDGHVMTKIF